MTRACSPPFRTLLLGLAALLAAACSPLDATPAAAEEAVATASGPAPALVPAPVSLRAGDGRFALSAATPVHAEGAGAAAAARHFATYAARSHGLSLEVDGSGKGGTGGIRFDIDAAADFGGPEAYAIEVDPEAVRVSAADPRGLFYGAVTLWQLLEGDADGAGGVALPAVRIEDAPRFGWRGFMLDSARHFQSVDEIKRLLDAMARHKLNVFHWHLTDDQGWRIEIRRYPRLTEVGGCRIPAGDGGVDPRTGAPVPYCGHYTQAQIRDIVAYAAERHITVVPEIDVPGHAQAAVAAYPELGVTGEQIEVLNEWGVNQTLFNVEESTFEFLENVLAEVVELFPGTYIHLGGDEAVKDQWQASERVQARMRELGLADEAALQSHFIKRMERFLVARGRRLIGWDEILEGGLPPEATVMSWRGIEGGIEAARQGHDVVMTPSSELYLDYLQTDSPNEPPGRPAMVTLEQVYRFEPVPEALETDQQAHVLGVQANLWTEHARTFDRVQHHVFPRLAALAETAWTPAARRDYADFLERLPAQMGRYRAMGIAAATTPFEVLADVEEDRAGGAVAIALRNPLGYPVRYTLDGSEPGPDAVLYRAPLELALPASVRAAAFHDGAALAPPVAHAFDAASLLVRTDEQLETCPDTGRLLLRLEDDGPLHGERAIFDVTIFYPCWLWPQAGLGGIAALEIRAGRMPYYFQLAHDEPNRKFLPAQTAHGELVVQSGGCEGPLLATLPLPARPDADGFVTLRTPPLAAAADRTDLCFTFTGDTRPTMWVLDQARLIPDQPSPP
ncbi:family 20 glycosylhydrolase [Luteimonas sp. SJ-92]|uniref:beta-N-acetylhexosaminidase n=1 Tax=Luteimonas salinisoli TaxID=2752307 RepID=A0A853JFJ3_9GAMM|nr:family 20 glycosylhydrolase [Luteimonas salinisoli]NZA27300.1 family 20 glycosylhydrolase [Luteimonas salinisoli]